MSENYRQTIIDYRQEINGKQAFYRQVMELPTVSAKVEVPPITRSTHTLETNAYQSRGKMSSGLPEIQITNN